MGAQLCPLHNEPIIGYSVIHRCFYCGQCEDCVGDEGNIMVDKILDGR